MESGLSARLCDEQTLKNLILHNQNALQKSLDSAHQFAYCAKKRQRAVQSVSLLLKFLFKHRNDVKNP